MSISADNPFGYGTEIWRLFREAPRAGSFPAGASGVVRGEAGTPASRARLRIALRFDGERIVDARFSAYGCPTTIAVGAYLAGAAIGRSREELRVALDAGALRAALEIPEDRAHCALLGEDALRAALAVKIKETVT